MRCSSPAFGMLVFAISGMAVGSCGSVLAATKLCANIIQPGSVDTIGLTVFLVWSFLKVVRMQSAGNSP